MCLCLCVMCRCPCLHRDKREKPSLQTSAPETFQKLQIKIEAKAAKLSVCYWLSPAFEICGGVAWCHAPRHLEVLTRMKVCLCDRGADPDIGDSMCWKVPPNGEPGCIPHSDFPLVATRFFFQPHIFCF